MHEHVLVHERRREIGSAALRMRLRAVMFADAVFVWTALREQPCTSTWHEHVHVHERRRDLASPRSA